MIAASARSSLDMMTIAGLRNAFPAAAGSDLSVETTTQICPDTATQMVVLMIASHHFRLVFTVYFALDTATRRYLVGTGRLGAGDLSTQAFMDAMSESGNMFCGAVNREIGRFYRHTGMSTPHIIDSRSGPHMAALHHQHLRHFQVGVDGEPLFQATLCASASKALDFEWLPEAEPEATGELEFF